MRYVLFFLSLILSNFAYAIPCPNNSNIIYKGDSLATILQQCGAPLEKNTYTRNVISVEQWQYYISNWDYANAKITLLFSNGRISNINVIDNSGFYSPLCSQVYTPGGNSIISYCNFSEYNTFSIAMCGTIVSTGDTTQRVLAVCGNPPRREVLQNDVIQVTELRYGGANAQIMTFENNTLIDWK